MKHSVEKLAEELAEATLDHNRLQRLAGQLTERLAHVRRILQRLDSFPDGPCLVHDCMPTPVVHPLTDGVLIGSRADCHIALVDDLILPQHARIEATSDGWTLLAQTSSTAIEVNGSSVSEAILASGDVIRIGRQTLIFVGTTADLPFVP